MKLEEMIGLPVFEVESGKEIGEVLDVLLSSNWQVTGIVLEGRSLFSPSIKAVKWDDITAYGEDAIMISSDQVICKMDASHIELTFSIGDGKVKELPVLTHEGELIGHVSDVYFDQHLGNNITGFEISDGFISDLMEGRKLLPFIEGIVKGEHAVLVPPQSAERLQSF